MTEKDLYLPFRHKLEKLGFLSSCVFELKIVKGGRFPLSSVHQHQVDGLLGALHGLSVRLADQPFVKGGYQQKKPFDLIWLNNVDAFVVPIWYVPRKRKTAYLIPIKEFLKFKGKSVKESELGRFVGVEL